MSKVFISYRRDDSAGYAHAIHSQLLQHLSKDQVFMDVDTVEPGVDFVRAIEKAVGECDVLIALIGKRWVGEPGGASRLDNARDYVRLEVSVALERDIHVIPVLVNGMTMPNEDSLPGPVRPINRRNAIEISNTRFNYDVGQLITAVHKILHAADVKRRKGTAAGLVDRMVNQFKKDHGIDLQKDNIALERLREAAEKAMIELSSAHETKVLLPFITADATGPKHLEMKLTRADLES